MLFVSLVAFEPTWPTTFSVMWNISWLCRNISCTETTRSICGFSVLLIYCPEILEEMFVKFKQNIAQVGQDSYGEFFYQRMKTCVIFE